MQVEGCVLPPICASLSTHWAETTLPRNNWLKQSGRVAGVGRHLGPCPPRSGKAPLCSPGMLIRGLGPYGHVKSRACWRKRKACRQHELHAGFTRTHIHSRRGTDPKPQDHTPAAPDATLSPTGQIDLQWSFGIEMQIVRYIYCIV